MTGLAIIGGTGLTSLQGLDIDREETVTTPYGQPSAPLIHGRYAGREVIFLARHGNPHVIPPHKVNYRANIRALKDAGVDKIIGVNAAGGITAAMSPSRIAVPDQIIDYTRERAHTYFEDDQDAVIHVDFTRPYSDSLRRRILAAAADMNIVDRGTYGATQGPRLESAAEILRMERDGCDLVGMTGMPEAALARELNLDYASICMVVNWAAGKSDEDITMELIENNLRLGIGQVHALLAAVIEQIVSSE
jgi:5'-methylthioinosine phosphorylase